MTVIINGTVDFKPEDAVAVLKDAAELMAATRQQTGCRHYVWSLDPAVPGRVYVYENWESVADLAAHLAGHFYTDMVQVLGRYEMLATDILKYRIDHAEPVYDDQGVPRADFFSG
ncbi:antibiotic biosynthesis monooxygenase [Pseudomaricurvus alcaniphilus]|uniref:putative quinol monooxygenase n=1 Tax=Pseudomaricurvus alcaniphilus TaxID=1166482 RepID=UPI00140DB91E|nr:putative quinol monooxygenase [Pseudomaricurvus alcaniphilus]NHN39213.1 antibiotic biosynthesis monooxygenase [Pseudomaricurvus alcaniphilus]